MNASEFVRWTEIHCGLFDGVRRYLKATTLAEWERVLSAVPFDAAVEASRRMYVSEHRPKDYSDHAASIRRSVIDAKRKSNPEHLPDPKGEREWHLRQRFRSEWEALSKAEQLPWWNRACAECKCDPRGNYEKHVSDLILQYAWTLFSESKDPKAAKQISNVGWKTAMDLVPVSNEEWPL